VTGAQLRPPVGEADHVSGPDDAPVTLVEYGDFECPHCGRAYPIVESVRRQLGNRLRFVYRHFPLTEIHPHAHHAAEAAESAGAQGKFWEMHHALFEHQDALDDPSLVRHAGELGLDSARVARDLESGMYRDRVRDDFRSGVRSGANGTPTFFVNGERYDGPWFEEAAFLRDLREAADVAESAARA
jgi:formate-nitrite transporter family protein